MKTITHNLVKFAISAIILAILFRYFLTYGIETGSNLMINLSALFYAIAMFISGWVFGKKDHEYLPIYDIGFRFHFCTYIVHNSISELWFLFKFNSEDETINFVHITAIIWGLFVIIHLIVFLSTRKNAINSLEKKDLFD